MSFLKNSGLFIGAFLVCSLSNIFDVSAQVCSSRRMSVPLTKARLDQLAAAGGIALNKSGAAFENFALDSFRPLGFPTPSNKRKFSSPLREANTSLNSKRERFRNVIPDGTLPLISTNGSTGTVEVFNDSVFVEAKALQERTFVGLNYPQFSRNPRFQILGFIDALSRSPAAVGGLPLGIPAIPAIVFLTTSGVQIDMDVLVFAQSQNVGVYQTIACETFSPFFTDRLFLGETSNLNLQVYILNQVIPFFFNPGLNSRLIFPPDRPDEGSN